MVRTQIYLTNRQRKELETLAKTSGKKQSELIRDAVDQLIEQSGSIKRDKILKEAAGIWKNRTDFPDFNTMRSDWDRP